MRWEQGRRSDNVEDARGRRVARGIKLGGGAIILVAAVTLLAGGDLGSVFRVLSQIQGSAPVGGGSEPAPRSAEENRLADFVSVVLADTEDTWQSLFSALGRRYEPPTLVLFTDQIQSACGFASAAMGPFYCPGDRQVYIDLGFYQELRDRFGAPGDFAQAYVIAHEIGHHVQKLLGISDQVSDMTMRLRHEEDRNALSVRQELQADCFAGVWAHHANRQRQILEQGDIEEGLAAASAIGDDRIQRSAGQRVSPESFTHGSSDQRVRWFRRGLELGRLDSCDTFSADQL